ncbi:DNA mismatch repair endonuclease MutL [Shewanella oneidensis MR-1]|uniref:DNA mismatch repair protein MutL n=2 Tax=Shewanella oneidensis TaxID=70863 RepID=MUTL_SHEON|nr:DNA mismatch repair endonuclease MutL [Shewanella oneidensis]Q8EJ70.1 RecName: Full=DNA mismatch repair protein MutL [Shewanella oneidensis MR-1]AAN53679.1 DNA mismatch repair protein MutL [Shewanella oneidensis MR-1]MDX5997471.1 DNA mismatch repair endonuclease MutL [Shewanella oneidensis]MEE2027960.1 DNA mismatch repair protein MutL [Shewanella oneidensis]QKG95495.1 DNA mismatch repair endonuclease MutL [Shewanella oneidensis MR-1]
MGIQILPPQLANQIAAGEVVERPASVVKELVENSLDAGASRIDIEIDKGGSKLIKIRDNGSGIPKEELALALSRHATSKLHSLDDLEAILSFGFRGEALASISSVSRLTLTSRTAEQSEAWQAYAEGVEMAVKVMPAAHPVGSTIEVVDLFFNTPARRRFLKSDKTEFTHIDEWLKRIALVRGDIHFTLTHNGKTVRNYRPAMNEPQYLQRLTQVAGRPFADEALRVECQHDDLRLSGYLQSPWSTVLTDTHYFYVNGRLVRDRLVNHAVRQAFAQKAEVEQPGYVLMLDIDPHQVDVNVHPAKHEVRFHQSRYVHDYILQALQSALEEAGELRFEPHSPQIDDSSPYVKPETESSAFELQSTESNAKYLGIDTTGERQAEARVVEYRSSDMPKMRTGTAVQSNAFGSMSVPRETRSGSSGESRPRAELPSKTAIASYGALLQTPSYSVQDKAYQPTLPMPSILDGQFWVFTDGPKLSLLRIESVALATRSDEIETKLATGLIGQPLLMPVSVAADTDWSSLLDEHATLIRQLGLELTIRYQQLIIKKVPPYLRDCQLARVIPEWLQSLRFEAPAPNALAIWLAEQSLTGFISAPDVWVAYCQLTEEKRQQIASKAVSLPWQSWLEEQAIE